MTPPDIKWTAQDAVAMALCWAEFYHPENRDDTPETYWVQCSEHARNAHRQYAKKLMLLANVRGDAMPLLLPDQWRDDHLRLFMSKMDFTRENHAKRVLRAAWETIRSVRLAGSTLDRDAAND